MMPHMTLDNIRSNGLTKIYCKCGSITGLDRGTVSMKKRLNKRMECPACRNSRISREIEEINNIFDGVSEEDASFV